MVLGVEVSGEAPDPGEVGEPRSMRPTVLPPSSLNDVGVRRPRSRSLLLAARALANSGTPSNETRGALETSVGVLKP